MSEGVQGIYGNVCESKRQFWTTSDQVGQYVGIYGAGNKTSPFSQTVLGSLEEKHLFILWLFSPSPENVTYSVFVKGAIVTV